MAEEMTFTPAILRKFRREYEKALDAGKTEFTFQDHAFLCGYAKYLIEHLDQRFKEMK